jgi:hypothetical protein
MKKEEILAMVPGDKLNALVAKYMGWTNIKQVRGGIAVGLPPDNGGLGTFYYLPNYSTTIYEAQKVVERLLENSGIDFEFKIGRNRSCCDGNGTGSDCKSGANSYIGGVIM